MDEHEKDLGNEIWRLGQRVLEIIAQLARILAKQDADTERAQQRGWVIDAKLGNIDSELGHLKKAVQELEKAVRALTEAIERRQQPGLLADLPPFAKVILTLLLSAFVALAAGKTFLP